ncbi:MAG: HD domain-containing protein [Clostridia bacterium]|nr:HD domain-containing protein [Clostridia bacterium]
MNTELRNYIEKNILPQYEKNDAGHSLEHIEYVVRRCLAFAEQFENIDPDTIYTVAVFHDIAHHIDKKNHETLSAEIFYADEEMKTFFSKEERLLIKEAIEDHRASLDREPRSDYGKIISSADRSTDAEEFLRRTHAYTLKHFPESTEKEFLDRAFDHTCQKYGSNGYAKHYVKDKEYDAFREYINNLLQDRKVFDKKYRKINNFIDI